MRTDKMTKNMKNPYVLLERCNLADINYYKPQSTNGHFLIDPSTEELNYINRNNMLSLNFVSQLLGDNGRLFRSYVSLERLSPQDIEHLLNKKDDE